MSVDTLRRAAAAIRAADYYTTKTDPFMLAVADWLDTEAEALDARNVAGQGRPRFTWQPALTVARAYLTGEYA